MNRIFVAGGTSGIGRETVEKLAESGCEVVCACREIGRLPTHHGVRGIPFDATNPEADVAVPEELDGFVYFPGTITLKPFARLTDEDFLSDFEINVLGAVRVLRQALPALKRTGQASVVLFSTVAVETGLPYHASIAAAKGAVEGLVRSLAAELAPSIRVNAIAPSLSDTPLASNLINSEEKKKVAGDRHPLKRIGSPSEIADLVHFLLSDKAGFMTGQVLKVDGGLSAVRNF
ncbi:MAG: SDR family oxidoreductase [Verrucomicrobiota bacterium]